MAPESVVAGLWRVGGGTWGGTVPALSAEGDANAYVLLGPAGAVLIDCGSAEGRPAIEANVRATGLDPRELGELLLTHSHWDHTEAARDWQRAYGLRTHLNAVGAERLARGDLRLVGSPLHGPDYAFAPFAVDHAVADGERFELAGIALTARHLPGHTPDSTLYLLDHADLRVAICGDVAFGPQAGDGPPPVGFLCALWGSDLDAYVDSLRTLAELPIDLLLPGHGAVVGGRAQVREAVLATLGTAEALAADPLVRGNLEV
jgi:metallo-beta-lactamase class B